MTAIQNISLDQLKLSHTASQAERRKHFDQTALKELAESIKSVGLLQPLVVRPCPRSVVLNYLPTDQTHEIVAGERRFMAAQKAGLKEIAVSIRELTDEQVIEVQLVENLQREGLHELAEAEGYEALMKRHGYTVEQLVDKLGRSKAYVYGRLKLLALCKEARAAFYSGKLNASTALLLARIPGEGQQRKALKEITSGYDGVMSFRRAADHIQRTYMLKLAEASFPTDDTELVPAAGACGKCPKRTGNQPQLFDDVKSADVCTDPPCFELKVKAHTARQVADAKANGRKVITGAAAKKLMPYSHATPKGYVKLADHCYQDDKSRTYRQLIGKAVTPVLIEDPKEGKLIECVPEQEAAAQLRKAGIKARSSSVSPEQRQRETKAKAERTFRRAVLDAILAKAPAKLSEKDLIEAACQLFHEMHADTQKEVLSLLAIEIPKANHGYYDRDKAIGLIRDHLASDRERRLAQLMLCLTYSSEVQVSTWSDGKAHRLIAAAKRLRIDVDSIRKGLQAPAKKKPAARKAK